MKRNLAKAMIISLVLSMPLSKIVLAEENNFIVDSSVDNMEATTSFDVSESIVLDSGFNKENALIDLDDSVTEQEDISNELTSPYTSLEQEEAFEATNETWEEEFIDEAYFDYLDEECFITDSNSDDICYVEDLSLPISLDDNNNDTLPTDILNYTEATDDYIFSTELEINSNTPTGPIIALIDSGAPAHDNVIDRQTFTGGTQLGDDNGHGTQMLNLILAQAPNAQIMSLKVSDGSANPATTYIIDAIDYAMNHNADIINLSITKIGNIPTLAAKVKSAADSGIYVCVAAGNYNTNLDTHPTSYTPPCVTEAITVGVCYLNGYRREVSNYGTPVDYYVNIDYTSDATATMSGYIAAHGLSSFSSSTTNNLIYAPSEVTTTWNSGSFLFGLTYDGSVTSNADFMKPFTCNATLNGYPVTESFGDLTFTNGTSSFNLTKMLSRTASSLPEGVTVSAQLSNRDGFIVENPIINSTIVANTVNPLSFRIRKIIPLNYTIWYFPGAGNGSMGYQTVTSSSNTLSTNTFTYSGYTFIGWRDLSGRIFSENDYVPTDITSGSNYYLVAMWMQN